MSIQAENFVTEELVAGNIVSAYKQASATTYYCGQLLGRTDTTGVYGPFNATGTYAVLNETDIPVGAVIIVDGAFAGVSSGTAVLSNGILYVEDATDYGLAVTARNAVAGLEKIRAVCILETVLSAPGKLPVYITGSEVQSSGLKATNGTALTVTTAIIELAQDAGIVIK